MKPKLISLLAILYSLNLLSQNPIWIIAPKYSTSNSLPANLPLGPNPTIDYHGQTANYSSNAIADEEGNLRLFTVDDEVFDYAGYLIGNLYGSYQIKGRSETAMVVNPSNCNQIYVFAVGRNYSNPADNDIPTFSVIDFSENSESNVTRKGSVGVAQMLPAWNTTSIKKGNSFIAISKKRSDNSHLIFVSSSDRIVRYKLDGNGVTYLGFSELPNSEPQTFVRGEMELFESPNPSADGYRYRIALPYFRMYAEGGSLVYNHSIYTANLDNSGVPITSSIYLNDYTVQGNQERPFVRGLEFDKTGSILFISHDVNTAYPSAIDCINFNVSNQIIPLNLTGATDFQNSQIEFGKINNQEALYVINSSKIGKIDISYHPLYPWLTTFSLNSSFINQGVAPSYMGTDAYWSNYLDYKTYLLPDQIDGMNYQDFNFTSYDQFSYAASTNATWSPGNNPLRNDTKDYVYIKDELRIPKGKIITISGLKIHFAPNARLIIENGDGTLQGGRLTLTNGTVLTSDDRCSSQMWHGVEVWGNASVVQGTLASSQQGILIISGSTSIPVTIENALFGAAARATNPSTGALVSGKYGGIIYATNGLFLNNQNDVILSGYISGTASNVSRFINSTFKTTRLLNNPSLALGNHIGLTSVQGVSILGCDFMNTNMDLFQIDGQGIGIYAVNASFFADKRCSASQIPCTPDDPNTFTNLCYGIASGSIFSNTLTFRSDGNIFDNNAIGIYVSATRSPLIVRNNFLVREITANHPIINQSSGIFMNGSTGFTVEENSFEERDNPLVVDWQGNTYGIVVRNSSTANNRIYRNIFTKLKIGGQAELTNGSIQSGGNGTGLVWKCNQFTAPIYNYDLALIDGTINYHQGYVTSSDATTGRKAAANNQFSNNNEPTGITHDFFVSSSSPNNNINYIDYFNQAFFDLDSYSSTKIGRSPAMVGSSYLTYSDEGCPSNYTTGTSFKMAQPTIGSEESTSLEFSANDNLFDETELYYQFEADINRNLTIQSIMLDTNQIDKNAVIMEFLSTQNDVESKKMLKEIQVLNDGTEMIDNVQSLNSELVLDNEADSIFSEDFLDLLEIKLSISAELELFSKSNKSSVNKLNRLEEIASNTEDVLLAQQASVILSLSKPIDLTYHFLEAETEKSSAFGENNSLDSEKESLIYPNPVSKTLFVQVDLKQEETISATVFTVLGAEVGSWTLSNESNSLDVSNLQNGVYIIHLTNATNDLNKVVRFVKK